MLNNEKIEMDSTENKPDEQSKQLVDTDSLTTPKIQPQVILFNDEFHFFEEVVYQLMLACNHSHDKAEELTISIDRVGKAKVYEGEIDACIIASDKLEEIRLKTQILY